MATGTGRSEHYIVAKIEHRDCSLRQAGDLSRFLSAMLTLDS